MDRMKSVLGKCYHCIFLNTTLLRTSGYFFVNYLSDVKFNKASFGGQNVCDHSLIHIGREKNKID